MTSKASQTPLPPEGERKEEIDLNSLGVGQVLTINCERYDDFQMECVAKDQTLDDGSGEYKGNVFNLAFGNSSHLCATPRDASLTVKTGNENKLKVHFCVPKYGEGYMIQMYDEEAGGGVATPIFDLGKVESFELTQNPQSAEKEQPVVPEGVDKGHLDRTLEGE